MDSHVALQESINFLLNQGRHEGVPVTEALSAFLAQTILNPRTNMFYFEGEITKEDLSILQQECLKLLHSFTSPSLQTINLQISLSIVNSAYDNKFIEFEMARQEIVKNNSMLAGQLLQEILSLDLINPKDFEGISSLYKKIFTLLLQRNKEISLIPESTNSMEKEVAAALESVIPKAALAPFVSLTASEKMSQLEELAHLVIGIRLFNKEIGKGGSNLVSVDELVHSDLRSMSEELEEEIAELSEVCETYSLLFSNIQYLREPLQSEEFEKLRGELTFLRQYLAYLLSMQEEVELSENTIESNEGRYRKEIEELRYLLGNKSSAPKDQVYPKFAILSQTYSLLVEEYINGTNRLAMYFLLKSFRQTTNPSLDEIKQKEARVAYAAGQLEANYNSQPISVHESVEQFLPETTTDYLQIPLDYLGFCIHSLVKNDGILIPGKPSLGVYCIEGKNAVFSNEKAIIEFMESPQKFINDIVGLCRRHPELIRLLRLEDAFPKLILNPMSQGNSNTFSTKLMVDKGISTETHFPEKNLDPFYDWNEWDLRKKAIQLANIRKKQTRGCQTILSNFKVESEVQVWQKRENSSNTGKSVGTNPLRPRNYIWGLRDRDTQ